MRADNENGAMMTRSLIGILLLGVCLAGCGTTEEDADAGTQVTDAGKHPDGGDPPPPLPPCTKLVALRLWTTNPSAVALLYRAEHCDDGRSLKLVPSEGQRIVDVYALTENDSPLNSEAVPRVSLATGQRVYVSLLLDFSASTTPVKGELLDSAQQFAKTLLENTEKAYIELRLFDGRASPHTVVRPTRDLEELDEAITKLRRPSPGVILGPNPDTGSTNLNGAFLSGVRDLQRWQEVVMSRNAGGVVTSGYVVVFTDGADTSERVDAFAAMGAVQTARVADGTKPEEPNVQTYAVALTGADFSETARKRLQDLARGEAASPTQPPNNRYYLEGKIDELTTRFTELARRIANESEATHLLTYCSPARAGQRTVSLQANATYGGAAAEATGVRFTFSAESFAAGCAEFFETVCEDKECGGFNCGSCDDAVDLCRPSDGRCVNECLAVDQCSGESFTNDLGYSRICNSGAGVAMCSSQCIDSSSDPRNCGGCGVQCATGASCQEGQCTCPFGTVQCGGVCRTSDYFESNQNCGTCGNACGGGSACNGGECVCPGGDTFCSGACRGDAYFESSSSNCGTCGNTCTILGEACEDGVCGCPDGDGVCGGQCVSLRTNTNCGTCGNACTNLGEVCEGGGCECPTGQGLCEGACVSLDTTANCGACGEVCGSMEMCARSESACVGSAFFEWAQWPIPPDAPTAFTTTADTVMDGVTGLVWQRGVSGDTYTWANAGIYCAELSLAGKSDWRLPTVVELNSIVDLSRASPSIDATAFPDTPSEPFWSSTADAYNEGDAWFVAFGNGWVGNYKDVGDTSRVRCVR